jgi:hypothetical protein
MTLSLPDSVKHARIVVQIVGTCSHLNLRHVPIDWVLDVAPIYGYDIFKNVARFRGEKILDGYVVEPGYTVEDGNPTSRAVAGCELYDVR